MLHDPKYETKIKARAILNAAADYIEKHGWCQRVLKAHDGRVCIMGALNAVACGEVPGPDFLSYEVGERLHQATGHVSVASWNDAHGRTKEQVVAALRQAATA